MSIWPCVLPEIHWHEGRWASDWFRAWNLPEHYYQSGYCYEKLMQLTSGDHHLFSFHSISFWIWSLVWESVPSFSTSVCFTDFRWIFLWSSSKGCPGAASSKSIIHLLRSFWRWAEYHESTLFYHFCMECNTRSSWWAQAINKLLDQQNYLYSSDEAVVYTPIWVMGRAEMQQVNTC